MSAVLEGRNVSFAYAASPVLSDLSFSLEEGQVLSIVGPSGCGKSTLISLILGLRNPTQGELRFHGQLIEGPSRKRMVVFQDHALFPWLTVIENVTFALEAGGMPGAEARARARRELERVGLSKVADRYPSQLSGGMQQRLGIARAWAVDPELLLLDEPFSSVDSLRRRKLFDELAAQVRNSKKTVVFVTHDLEEAMALGDQILVLGSPRPVAQALPKNPPREFQDSFKEKVHAAWEALL